MTSLPAEGEADAGSRCREVGAELRQDWVRGW